MNDAKAKTSIWLVIKFVVLMLAIVFVIIKTFTHGQLENNTQVYADSFQQIDAEPEDILAAKAMFLSLKEPQKRPYAAIDPRAVPRDLASFYPRRAYSGAPPVIPHSILDDSPLTGENCLACHQHGGYTPKWNAYAPVTPHPQLILCRQCHSLKGKRVQFKPSSWTKHTGRRGIAYLPGSPLVIPHSLQLRENCLACHSGPAAVKEIRTSHPERLNCLQCHVEAIESKGWLR